MGQAQMMMKQWSMEMDTALVSLVNELCRSLAVSSSRLHAHELILTEVQLASQQYACLHSKSECETIRSMPLYTVSQSVKHSGMPVYTVSQSVKHGQQYVCLHGKSECETWTAVCLSTQ